jgi:uncharacterized Ntn-hydrolase superfamily protein
MKAGVAGAALAVVAIGAALWDYISSLGEAAKAQKAFEKSLDDIDKQSQKRVKALEQEGKILAAQGADC